KMCIYLNLMILIKIIRGFISIEQQGNISIKWLEQSKPVSCLAHYQQSPEAEKIAQSIILNGIRCQIQ
ncbi:hypothetical protein, partial [Escherichia coli]|uniref:hypothetical protein n=1 Tax=Escherichia coli TaxID=562 RepID=UPI0015610C4D